MPDKIFFHLLILCGIWSQEIIGTFADENINESSNFLVRQKRVIGHRQGEALAESKSSDTHAVVVIRNMEMSCVGNILSNVVAITASVCVEGPPSQYQVRSHAPLPRRGTHHTVREIRIHTGGHRDRARDGVGLVVVNPPFVYSAFCRNIPLHSEPLPTGSLGKVSGWGIIGVGEAHGGTDRQKVLRTIEVPIIGHQDCANRYRPHISISDLDVCTYHPQRHCGRTDLGAGLVVNHRLAGIFLGSGMVEGYVDPQYPDIFALLQSLYYIRWIEPNVADLTAHYLNNHH